MGAVGGLVGLGGGAAGTSFQGPSGVDLTTPVTADQANQAYAGTQQAMQGQQGLLNALQAQNGLANQSQVYGQLQGIASGAVNPAQAQFAQNTSQNVANQAALMAGQRGASANVGLMARQAAQQGAATQQQAVGQEAAQQAQNQIAAIQGAGNLATTQAGQQIGQTNANVAAQQAEQGQLLGGIAAQNNAKVGMQSNINQANAGLANTQMQGQQGLIGGGMNGVGALIGAAGGGEIVKMAAGGPAIAPMQAAPSGPSSLFGNFINNPVQAGSPNVAQGFIASGENPGAESMKKAGTNIAQKKKQTPQAPAPDTDANTVGYGAQGAMENAPLQSGSEMNADTLVGAAGGVADYSRGSLVKAMSKGQQAVKDGNSYSNDKIPAVLSEHEIVLPRSVTLSKDPIRESAKFVAKIISQRKGKK